MTQPLELDNFLAHHGSQILAPIGPYEELIDESLSHYGIPGMRWGRRRGSSAVEQSPTHKRARDMTDQELKSKTTRMETEKKYNSMVKAPPTRGLVAKTSLDSAATATREAHNVVGTLNRRKEAKLADQKRTEAKQLSDKELKDKINRLNMEQQYRNLTTRDVSVGKANVEDILSIAGSAITVAAAGVGMALTIKQLMGQ